MYELNDYIDTFIYIVNIYNRSPSKNDIVAAFSGWSMATTAAEAIAEKCDFSEGDFIFIVDIKESEYFEKLTEGAEDGQALLENFTYLEPKKYN